MSGGLPRQIEPRLRVSRGCRGQWEDHQCRCVQRRGVVGWAALNAFFDTASKSDEGTVADKPGDEIQLPDGRFEISS